MTRAGEKQSEMLALICALSFQDVSFNAVTYQ